MTRFINGKSQVTLSQLHSKTIRIGEIFHHIDFSFMDKLHNTTTMFGIRCIGERVLLFKYGVRFFLKNKTLYIDNAE